MSTEEQTFQKKGKTTIKKVLKRMGITLLCLVLVVVLVVGGYIVYLLAQYNRIPDETPLAVQNNQVKNLQLQTEYTALTYNIGFGAYDPAFSFFLDEGKMADGTKVVGQESRAASKEVAERNTLGAITELEFHDADFCLLQEVDEDADRSWHINQVAQVEQAFPQEAAVFASNFHSAYLLYPPTKPHGAVQSGLLSLSKYQVDDAMRYSLPVDAGFPTKFFDLDRCFSLLRIPVEGGGELVLINLHLSAYDEGGTIRAQQMEMLARVMKAEKNKGNWVIAGGDFNHAIGDTLTSFSSGQQKPEWIYPFDEAALPQGFKVVKATNSNEVPTCRSADIPYEKGVNYTTVVDGFIVSNNVSALADNIDTDFAYSDHNPVYLRFILV